MILKGRVWKFGDNIDTDIIIPARYLALTDPKALGEHCMKPIAPTFSQDAKPGDIMVGGYNFGSGSSREHAPIAILALGIPLIVAKSFARIFYRNAFNKGLALLEADLDELTQTGDEIEIRVLEGLISTPKGETRAKPIPPFMVELIHEGGLMNYLKKKLEAQ